MIWYRLDKQKGYLIIDNTIEINTKMIPPAPGIFIVGGTVRDMLLGRPASDFDIAAAPPCEPLARQIAEKARSHVITLGKPGMAIYRVVSGGRTFDIAPIAGGGIENDLRRRDFTINAMAWDTYHQRLVDPLSGRRDLGQGQIRMVSPENLQDDPVRLLRAFRFGAMLQFAIEARTKEAIRFQSSRIRQTAGERIRDEWLKMTACPEVLPYIREMADTGLLTEIFPELSPLKQCRQNSRHQFDVFEHTMRAFWHLERLIHHPDPFLEKAAQQAMSAISDPAILKLAVLLHDIGKPACRQRDAKDAIHFFGHEAAGAAMARDVGLRLKLSGRHLAYLDFIVRHHLNPLFLFIDHRKQKLKQKRLIRFFLKSAPLTIDLLVHALADGRAKQSGPAPDDEFEKFCGRLMRTYFSHFRDQAAKPPLINGHDLIETFGLTPSPLFSELLSRVEEERLSGRLQSRPQALEWVKNFLIRNKDS